MKIAVVLVSCVALLGSLTACGKDAPPAPAPEASPPPAAVPAAAPTTPEPAADAPRPPGSALSPAEQAAVIAAMQEAAKKEGGGANDATEACTKAAACCEAAARNDDEKAKCKQLGELAALGSMLEAGAQAKMKAQCDAVRETVAKAVTPVPDACK
ncbi:MAG: hypothetical protein CVU56_26530 [Deltaproteobacteria bacterium HGW-Deltaproteobacteria-14]|jgi:hypothetical protein|nr:MAG: hypothetical protein CVU56_26530 [Deltaproteobacteria bacterium HGW-Deltaproteobacteria-14]